MQSEWVRSSKCESSACTEVAIEEDNVMVRNSQKPDKVAEFDTNAWEVFLADLRAGDFKPV